MPTISRGDWQPVNQPSKKFHHRHRLFLLLSRFTPQRARKHVYATCPPPPLVNRTCAFVPGEGLNIGCFCLGDPFFLSLFFMGASAAPAPAPVMAAIPVADAPATPSAGDIVDGGGQARLAKTTVVLLAQIWEHVYSDVSGWSPYFGNWGISQIWLELIRADVLVVKGRYSEFLEVPPIAKPKDGMHDPSMHDSPPKDGGTDCHDSGAAPTATPSTASPSPSRMKSISLLQHRASLQRASVTIALWYAKEPKLKKFASSESDSARLILLKLLQALPLERVLHQPAPPALAGTATAESGGFSLGLVSGALDQVVSRALHMLFICYEAEMVRPPPSPSHP